ncbi:MAG: glycosyltransferase family 4 protein [Actinomycetota bacterium]|nr:glycosyltransferase family 4 protein [Actinomycetota bacterium]
MKTPGRPLRIALLTYRGNPYSGGQGVYVRYLSKAFVDLGHEVTVFSGPPYPDVQEGVELVTVPSLDLYRSEDPFRVPARHEFRDAIDYLEFGIMCGAGFPEPLTFTLRAARMLIEQRRRFDIVHDNQSLGYGLLRVQNAGLPVVATIHHPCSIDREIELTRAQTWKRRASLRRFYGFTRMQARVGRRLPRVITVSDAARLDAVHAFGLASDRVTVVHNGVDVDLFRPAAADVSIPGRIVTTASADVPLKGLVYLIEALAKVRTEHEDAHLVVVGAAAVGGPVARAIERFGLKDVVTFETRVDWLRLVELYHEAQVAVVPSLYEGFSLPAAEAMSSGTALVATDAGALPEVVGPDGEAALVTPPGDPGALAAAIGRILDDRELRRRLADAGRQRILDRFTWRSSAAATTREYERVIGWC